MRHLLRILPAFQALSGIFLIAIGVRLFADSRLLLLLFVFPFPGLLMLVSGVGRMVRQAAGKHPPRWRPLPRPAAVRQKRKNFLQPGKIAPASMFMRTGGRRMKRVLWVIALLMLLLASGQELTAGRHDARAPRPPAAPAAHVLLLSPWVAPGGAPALCL